MFEERFMLLMLQNFDLPEHGDVPYLLDHLAIIKTVFLT